MNDQPAEKVPIQAAAITDRGLSQKRPVNEDSYLADPARRLFAVADGVGGAQAGEVASQRAVEVLDEAFRHHEDDADIEDLMELAIQRANDSIFRLSREQSELTTMATTFVALHLDGYRATIGHVGDSRLYRLTPDREIRRETKDHSIVEEEVRAGRMTPEQALNHPSRNVISRALGAEAVVEVDMKTIEVKDGTTFLLCSDGITRHIPDDEIRDLLSTLPTPEEVCEEMKKRCYERGAEDNLTAVIVHLGDPAKVMTSAAAAHANDDDDERTISTDRDRFAATLAESDASSDGVADSSQATFLPPQTLIPASRIAFPATATPDEPSASDSLGAPVPPPSTLPPLQADAIASTPPARVAPASAGGKIGRTLAFLFLLVGASAASFVGGMYFQMSRPVSNADSSVEATPTPTQTPLDQGAQTDNAAGSFAPSPSPVASPGASATPSANIPNRLGDHPGDVSASPGPQ